ncbi:FhaA domain-containing protein [Williamsia sp.]|uniref:FhaA domain-containing protein n=1 Tax=Williamsia sp. TaxID=1872085 RepID=UPI002F93EAFC
MGILQRIERKLEGAVDDGFARVFGGKVAPQEVENALQREAEDHLEDLGDGSKLAPNAYTLVVSSTDHQEMAAEYELNRKTFSKHLDNFIRDNGWQTYGEVVVEFAHSPTLHTGQFRARGAVNPDARPMPVPSPGEQPIGPPPPRPQAGPHPAGPNRTPQVGADPMTKNSGYDPRGGYEQGSYPPPGYGQQPAQAGEPQGGGPQAYSQQEGYDQQGYDQQGYDQRGYDQQGYDQGYQQGGYAQPGYDQGGYAPAQPGYDQGYQQGGYDPAAYSGEQQGAGAPDQRGYEQGGYDQGGYAPDQAGYAQPGYDQGGYERGYDQQPAYGQQGYAQPGYDQGYQQGGYDQGYAPADHQGGYDQGYAPADQQGGYAGQAYAAPAGYAPSSITLLLEDGSNRTFQLRNGSNVIGRGQDAQFRLPDTGVSRRHVEIRWDGSSALLNDLNSTNGTTVNDVQVSSWELADGDRIRVGHSDITVRFQ